MEQDAVDLEGEVSPGFNTAEALRALLVKKGIITPEVRGRGSGQAAHKVTGGGTGSGAVATQPTQNLLESLFSHMPASTPAAMPRSISGGHRCVMRTLPPATLSSASSQKQAC